MIEYQNYAGMVNLMARKRMIDPSFWTDEKLGECLMEERLLFMGLISNADDEGYGRANSKLLKSVIFPYDDISIKDLEKWLSHITQLGLVILYEYDGQVYYNLPNFLKHQKINRPTETTFPRLDEEGIKTFTEDSLNTHGVLTANRREKKLKEEKRKEEKESVDDFITTYSHECSKLPQIKTVTDSRKKAIGLFKKTYTLKDWEEICRTASTCDFLLRCKR